MKKKNIIKKANDFTTLIKTGKKIKNNYYSVYYQNVLGDNKYGISIPKKIGTAVVRNKIKRQIKNIIDNNKNTIQNNREYVIIVKDKVLSLDYKTKEEELLKIIKK